MNGTLQTDSKQIPPSIYNAYFICPRQSWLMFRQLNADQRNSSLQIGKLIDETSFEREKKKIYISDISAMVDMVTPRMWG
jgi:CRISPR-associated exonuclease Cas4